MATRRKKQQEVEVIEIPPPEKCYIITTQAVYVNNYVIRGANSQEEAEVIFAIIQEGDTEEERPVVLQQLQYEEILLVKEAN